MYVQHSQKECGAVEVNATVGLRSTHDHLHSPWMIGLVSTVRVVQIVSDSTVANALLCYSSFSSIV